MTTSIFFLILLGCFILLKTSKKAVVPTNTFFDDLIRKNIKLSKASGIITLLVAMFLAINILGFIGGALFWILSLVAVFSLVIIITPLKVINYKGVLFLFFVGLIIEKIIY